MQELTNQSQENPIASKEAVRGMVKQWIIDGLSDREMSARRAELAEDLGVSLRSLASVSAYVRYPATVAIRASGLEEVLDRDQLIWAAAFVETASDDAERANLLRECGNHLGIDPERLGGAIRIYHAEQDRKPNGLLEREPRVDTEDDPRDVAVLADDREPEGAQETLEADGLEDLIVPPVLGDQLRGEDVAIEVLEEKDRCEDVDDETGKRGDEIDYNFPSKVAWRREIAYAIGDYMSPRALRDAKVICLPGKEVEPEVSIYLKLGVRPENIVAVEGGRRHVRAEFEANARRLGIRHEIGRLEKILPTLRDRFDIVSYDFLGPHSSPHFRILRSTPVNERALLIYNCLGKRENGNSSQNLRMMPNLFGAEATGRTGPDGMPNEFQLHGRTFACPREAAEHFFDKTTVQHGRDFVTKLMPFGLGIGQAPEVLDVARKYLTVAARETDDGHLVALSAEMTFTMCAAVELDIVGNGLEQIGIDPAIIRGKDFLERLGRMAAMTAFRSRMIGQVRLLGYHSQANNGRSHSPYLTTMGTSILASDLFETCRPAVEFLGECAHYRRWGGAPMGVLVSGPETRRGADASVLRATDVLAAHLGEERRSIPVGTILAAERAYSSYIARHKIAETGKASFRRKWIKP
jgi:hypothetical protein